MGEYLALPPRQELGCVISPLLLPTMVPCIEERLYQRAACGPFCMGTQLGALLLGRGTSDAESGGTGAAH